MIKRLEMNHKGLPEFDENGTWVFFSDYHALEQKFKQVDSDAQVGAELSERLAKQLSELQQKLDAMAAENAALKSSLKGTVEWCYSDDLPETPATDAYLNSVRAEGVKIAINKIKVLDADPFAIHALECKLAEILRSGTHDTADKAG